MARRWSLEAASFPLIPADDFSPPENQPLPVDVDSRRESIDVFFHTCSDLERRRDATNTILRATCGLLIPLVFSLGVHGSGGVGPGRRVHDIRIGLVAETFKEGNIRKSGRTE